MEIWTFFMLFPYTAVSIRQQQIKIKYFSLRFFFFVQQSNKNDFGIWMSDAMHIQLDGGSFNNIWFETFPIISSIFEDRLVCIVHQMSCILIDLTFDEGRN